jgi:hypothetical protein
VPYLIYFGGEDVIVSIGKHRSYHLLQNSHFMQ